MADLAVSSAVPEQAIDDEVEEMHVAVKNSVHQRLRANSSIMQLKKLLGESQPPRCRRPRKGKNVTSDVTC